MDRFSILLGKEPPEDPWKKTSKNELGPKKKKGRLPSTDWLSSQYEERKRRMDEQDRYRRLEDEVEGNSPIVRGGFNQPERANLGHLLNTTGNPCPHCNRLIAMVRKNDNNVAVCPFCGGNFRVDLGRSVNIEGD